MKFHFEKKYVWAGITAFLVIAGAICFYYLIFHGDRFSASISSILKISSPVVYGMVLAYLLTPAVNGLERSMLKPLFSKNGQTELTIKKKKIIRCISIIITIVIMIFLIYGFFSILIPNLIQSIQNISSQFPTYIQNLSGWSAGFLEKNPDIERLVEHLLSMYSEKFTTYLNESIVPQLESLLKQVSLSMISVLRVLWNLIIGVIISIYVLFNKETFAGQAKKLVYALLQTKAANQLIKDVRFTSDTFIGFISGKIVDSAIIGCLCFVGTTALDMPYALLISVIVGVTNIIPFFGPYLGAIPCSFLVLMVNPVKCLYFVIFILVLQQLDGNVIGPKILGESTGLSGFWVIFSITIFGGIWGVPGMIIGVPFWAVIYAMIRRRADRLLTKKGLPTETEKYLEVDHIDGDIFVPKNTSFKNSFFKIKWKKSVTQRPSNTDSEIADKETDPASKTEEQ